MFVANPLPHKVPYRETRTVGERGALNYLLYCRRKGSNQKRSLTHFRYAEILHGKGDTGAAQERLDKPAALFPDMEMTWWSEHTGRLEAQLKEE